MTNEELREASGKVSFEGRITSFLYVLMRDHLPAGTLEEIVRDSEKCDEFEYTNGWLAQYANNLAKRLER